MPRYRELQETVHALLMTAFSRAVITPGTTTTEDVEWWLRQRIQDLGMTTWFHPDAEHAAAGSEWGTGVIQRGDALWVDFGRQEEDAYLDAQGDRHWVYARQERFYLVR